MGVLFWIIHDDPPYVKNGQQIASELVEMQFMSPIKATLIKLGSFNITEDDDNMATQVAVVVPRPRFVCYLCREFSSASW